MASKPHKRDLIQPLHQEPFWQSNPERSSLTGGSARCRAGLSASAFMWIALAKSDSLLESQHIQAEECYVGQKGLGQLGGLQTACSSLGLASWTSPPFAGPLLLACLWKGTRFAACQKLLPCVDSCRHACQLSVGMMDPVLHQYIVTLWRLLAPRALPAHAWISIVEAA